MSGKLEGIRVRFLLWIHNLGLVCLWIIDVLLYMCAESRVRAAKWAACARSMAVGARNSTRIPM